MGLPSGYQQVEYIQSTGNQYIEVNYPTANITRVSCKAQVFSGSPYVIIGTGVSSSISYSGIRCFSTNGSNLYCGLNTGRSELSYTPASTPQTWIIDKTLLQIGSTEKTISYSGSSTATSFAIFKDKEANKDANSTKCSIYWFKVYENGVLKLNFIPCYKKSDNVIGMYETETGAFYTNSGSGTFVKGANVSSVTYRTVLENTISGFNDIQESLSGIFSDISQPGNGKNAVNVRKLVNSINNAAAIKLTNGTITRLYTSMYDSTILKDDKDYFTTLIYDPTVDGGSNE